MAVDRMCRLIIVGVKRKQESMERLLKEIIASECFEPLSLENALPPETKPFFKEDGGTSFEEAFSLLCKLHKLSGKEPSPRPVFSPEIASRLNFSLKKARLLERKMDQKLSEILELKRLVERFEHMRRHLRTLRYLDVDFEDLISLEGFSIKFGRILSMYFDRLIESVNDAPILVVDIERERESQWIMVFTLPRMQKEAESILQSIGFEEHTLPRAMLKGSVEEVYFRVSDEIKKLCLEIERKNIELREIFYKNRTFIYQLLDHLYVLRSVYRLQERVGFSESLFALSGWVPEREKKKIQRLFEQEETLVIEEQPDTREVLEEKVPVRLSNHSFFRPFESLVKMYGLPSYWEVDPTPVVALTFLFMFGFMFGDVGHGAILALAGFVYYLKKRSDLGWVFGWAGLSSVLFGFLYGSFLGFESLLPALWVRPIEEISYLMGISVAIGVILLALGMGLGMFNLIRAGHWKKFLLGSSGLAAFAFYWLGVWLVFSYFRYGELPRPANLWLSLLVVLLVVIYLHEVFEASPSARREKAVESTFVLFDEIIRFLSNTLSFIRLAAFAINHAGIFLAFLSIAQMVQGGGAFSGVSRVLVIIFGNLLILGLEGLVVFIQALRLEFYELFSRFFAGRGRPFQPVTFREISTERR